MYDDHLPELLPDESLYSLVARYATLNGYTNHLTAARKFLGTHGVSVIDSRFPVASEDKAYLSSYLHEDGRALKLMLTRLSAHLGGRPLGLKNQQDLDEYAGLTFLEASFGSRAHWRYCSQCVLQDIKDFGVAYWHRNHQLPLTLICPIHHEPLIEKRILKKSLHDRLWLQHEMASEDTDETVTDYLGHWLALSELGRDSLADSTEAINENVIRMTFLRIMTMKGFIDRRGKLKTQEFNKQFESFFGFTFIADIKVKLNIKTSKYLIKGLLNEQTFNPLCRLILVYWLFGTWSYFKLSCQWENVLSEALIQNVCEALSVIDSPLIEPRKVCLAYINDNPSPTRLDFFKQHYKTFHWLLHRDRAWLDCMLPIDKPWKQGEMFTEN